MANFKEMTPEERAECGRRGGEKRGENHAKRVNMRERLEYLLARSTEPESDIDNLDVVCLMLVERAKKGNLRAIELLRDSIGEKPSDRQENKVSGNIVVHWGGIAQNENMAGAIATTVCQNVCQNEKETKEISA